jgi:hypothetical protein
MAFGNGPRIVTNGLVLSLDAADQNSYVSGSATWRDLSGNGNNGTLISGSTFDTGSGGAIVFDGTSGYVQFTAINVQTICFCCIADVGATNGLQCLIGTSALGDGALRLQYGTFRAAAPNAPDANDFNNGFVSQFMINGQSNLPTDSNGVYIVPNSRTLNQNFYIGCITSRTASTISHPFNGRFFKGKVFCVALYNRQLSNNELLQNYNAQKSRFNLT